MGGQVCKQPDNETEKSEQNQNKLACFQMCYPAQSQNFKRQNENINPIEFSDLGSDREADRHKTPEKHSDKKLIGEEIEENDLQIEEHSTSDNLRLQTGNKGEGQTGSLSPRNIELVIVNKEKTGVCSTISGENTYEPISVPYSVIKLMLKPEILKQLKNFDKNFEKKHGDPNSETYRTWKLQSKGYYTNRISDGTTIIITEDEFYQGFTKLESLTPENAGILINKHGSFKGMFKEGKANGKGSYVTLSSKRKCEGYWKNGEFSKGKLETEEYKYEGDFKKNVPDGRGSLEIFKNKIKYIGLFHEGYFKDDQGQYSCETYVYKGGFLNGKKHGTGDYIENEREKKIVGQHYKAPSRFKAEWKNDCLVKKLKNL